MAINPFRVGELQLPQPLRPVPIDFSPLQGIGDTIGLVRQQAAVGDIIRASTDAQGNLDHVKAADELSKAGLQRYAEPLYALANRKQALEQTGAAQRETTRHNKATEEALKTGKIPFGWEIGPDGTPFYTKGGPPIPSTSPSAKNSSRSRASSR